MDAIATIDGMIDAIFTPRQAPRPALGGGKPAPFDGELLGKFIRFCVLMELRDKLTGEDHGAEANDLFNARWKEA
jgi:hypothetical protein